MMQTGHVTSNFPKAFVGALQQHWSFKYLLSQIMQETRVQSLGQEDPLEKEMATYSSILAW